jgi:hypothetical protein
MRGNRDGQQVGRSDGLPSTPGHTRLVLNFLHNFVKDAVPSSVVVPSPRRAAIAIAWIVVCAK